MLSDNATAAPPNFEEALAALRPSLYRFALSQLRNATWAEDVVSETLLAALEKPSAFAGNSSLKTWVTGILKHKIIDQLRKQQREVQVETSEDSSADEALEALFDQQGHWVSPQSHWGEPAATLERTDFFRVLELCLDKLPANTARIFMMREWLELETDEICKELAISTSNCWVMLYRARMRLKECLELNWFGAVAA
ncbi:RNA polymerase subunit sigma [Parvibium lacunae]|uniref:RNA polymerase subunit sigma n=2 Tax=Parvibium lacunae TaxID=1888893 RepID=A0A368KZ95_9BURK|nr:sigma-70 family RNA polymerase sigma factor [Parvibium lacunae]RCS56685.1 RNA polymerase subunit sigma [Parvibium lacunae]